METFLDLVNEEIREGLPTKVWKKEKGKIKGPPTMFWKWGIGGFPL